jgi:hypothetical protein
VRFFFILSEHPVYPCIAQYRAVESACYFQTPCIFMYTLCFSLTQTVCVHGAQCQREDNNSEHKGFQWSRSHPQSTGQRKVRCAGQGACPGRHTTCETSVCSRPISSPDRGQNTVRHFLWTGGSLLVRLSASTPPSLYLT